MAVVARLRKFEPQTFEDGLLRDALVNEIEHYRGLFARITLQTTRRVLQSESVPASEKILSIFEPHTDLI